MVYFKVWLPESVIIFSLSLSECFVKLAFTRSA